VPAAWCGVVGLKPSAGLVPVTGHFPRVGDRSDGRTTLGALASSVELAWRAVRVMAGPDGADGAVAPVALGDPAAVDLAALSAAVGSPGGRPVSGEVEAALARSRQVLRDAGMRDAGPPPDWIDDALRVTEAYWQREDRTGPQIDQDLRDWDRFRREVLRATRKVDVVVTPTVGSMAPLHRAMRTEDYLFCLPASLTGGPALSVPIAGGAVQVIAARWQDHLVVAVAGLLEAASGS
jgi:Asp-tRNA(Asn)/Glu-tRNA(Gln) amidotransferase A subunit family amidase